MHFHFIVLDGKYVYQLSSARIIPDVIIMLVLFQSFALNNKSSVTYVSHLRELDYKQHHISCSFIRLVTHPQKTVKAKFTPWQPRSRDNNCINNSHQQTRHCQMKYLLNTSKSNAFSSITFFQRGISRDTTNKQRPGERVLVATEMPRVAQKIWRTLFQVILLFMIKCTLK